MIVWLAIGCARLDAATSPSELAPEGTSGPNAEPVERPWRPEPPIYERATFERSLDAVLTQVVALSAAPVVEAYDALVAHRDASCPQVSEDEADRSAWAGNCLTADGAAFSASGSDTAIEGGVDIGLSGTVQVGARSLSGRGSWSDSVAVEGDSEVHTTSLDGPVRVIGFAPGSWAAQGVSPTRLRIRRRVLAGSPTEVTIEGALAGVDTTFGTAELDLVHEGACPVGTVALRIPSGRWFEVRFDEARCDGCGTVRFHDRPVGEACASFDAWTGWTPTGETP